ncbi:hypothetical protein HMN09_00151500 [Mycena chlorophos]|uniref:F-box domain-containing protein n=1 Tax=Mycena chlorophos TaxID=658473 RepID=A0A8H6TS03_MYCCL|nr:hypothetical protein HMN09_00151500 [Mycena chlorophos]
MSGAALKEIHISDEVWDEILRCVPDEERAAVSTVSRQLRRISLPQLVKRVVLRAYSSKDGQLLLPSTSIVEGMLERLAFYTSPKIAPYVRSCKITTYMQTHAPFAPSNDPHLLQTAFFQKLSCFAGLRSLSMSRIHLTGQDLTLLMGLRSLESFEAEHCPLPSTCPPGLDASLTLPSLSFIPEKFDEDGEEFETWLKLIDTTKLRRVALRNSIYNADGLSSYPAVTELVTSSDASWSDVRQLERLLGCFPGIRRLRLDVPTISFSSPSHPDPSFIGDLSLDYLEELEIVEDFLGAFLPFSDTITRLNVYGMETRTLKEVFGTRATYTNLTSLFATILKLASKDLGTVLRHLTKLEKCMIVSEYEDTKMRGAENKIATKFFSEILQPKVTLPRTLTHLALFLNLDTDNDGAPIPHAFIDPVATCTTLRARLPRLVFMWLDGADFLIDWRAERSEEDGLKTYQVKRTGKKFQGRDEDASGKFMGQGMLLEDIPEFGFFQKYWHSKILQVAVSINS